MWQERLLTSSAASINVSVRIAIKNESTSSNDRNGSYLCTSEVKSDAEAILPLYHVPLPLVALSMLNNDIGNTTHFRDPFSLFLTLLS
jgi:hypothetical protein